MMSHTATSSSAMVHRIGTERPAQLSDLLREKKWPRDIRAYTTLMACFFCMFNSWGLVNAYGTFSSFYNESLLPDANLALLNLIGASESFWVLIWSWFIGRLLDAGYYRKLLFAGMALTTLGTVTLAFVSKTTTNSAGEKRHLGNAGLVWLTQGFITALGQACLFVASSQIVSTWFKKTKYFSIGIVACGASIAGVVYPFAVKYFIQNLGWQNAILSVSAIVCFTGFISFAFAVPNPEHKIRPLDKWRSRSSWVDTHAFSYMPYMWFVASISALFFGFYAVFFNLEEWAVWAGVGYRDSAVTDENHPVGFRTVYLLAIMNGASSLGRLGAGYVSDHWGALNVHCGVTMVSSIFILLLWTFANKTGTALAFVILFGIVSGAVIGLPPASVADILGNNPVQQSKLGQWVGMMYTAAAPFALAGPVIGGYLISRYGTFLTVQLWSGFCLFLSGCFMLAAIMSRRSETSLYNEKGNMTESSYTSNVTSRVVTRQPSELDLTDD